MIVTGKKFSKPELSRIINGDRTLDTGPEVTPKTRLDLLLVKQYPNYNRSTLQKFIAMGLVTVNGEVVTKANQKFEDNVTIVLDEPKQAKTAERPPVIYEDDNVIVFNKPAGLLSMAKGEYCPESTLEDFGLLVHRLDRDTSGVVILAKNESTQKMLRKQFQDRKTHKTYVAVAEGRPEHDEALINLPIGRNLVRPTTFQVDQNGKAAETYYKVLAGNENFCLVELKPKTGRTHQLRVHLKYLDTPIVGDVVYGDWTRSDNFNLTKRTAPRLYLHAKELEITIPGATGGIRKTFVADTPADFMKIIEEN